MASNSHTTTELLSDSNIIGTRLPVREHMALGVAVVMLSISLWLGWKSQDPGMFAKAYLQNFLFVLAIALGALFFVIIQHATRAGWSVAVRRPAEALMQNLRWIWVLFLPIAYMGATHQLDVLFPWANIEHLEKVAPAEAELVRNKASFLNPTFFFIRAAAYFVVWGGLAWFFWRTSTGQDRTGNPAASSRSSLMAAPGAILFGITVTLASVDWIMSLTPAWFSTMFGVYFFTVCCTAGLSAITLVCLALQRAGYLRGVITPEHYQDLGKLLFAFGVVFWAYIAFSQYMLIWYGNIPEETTWYLVRQVGGWGWVSTALLFGHFVVPFVFLVSRWTKRWSLTLAIACVWMLFFAWFDVYYLVIPTVPHDLGEFATYREFADKYVGESTNLANPVNWTMLVGMLALLGAGTLAAARRHPLLAKRDPRLADSLAFHNM